MDVGDNCYEKLACSGRSGTVELGCAGIGRPYISIPNLYLIRSGTSSQADFNVSPVGLWDGRTRWMGVTVNFQRRNVRRRNVRCRARIIPIRTCRFQTTGSTRSAGGWSFIFMMYSTLLPQGKRASLGCSKHVCRLPLRLRGRTPTCEQCTRSWVWDSTTTVPQLGLYFFTFQSSFDGIYVNAYSDLSSITLVSQ